MLCNLSGFVCLLTEIIHYLKLKKNTTPEWYTFMIPSTATPATSVNIFLLDREMNDVNAM